MRSDLKKLCRLLRPIFVAVAMFGGLTAAWAQTDPRVAVTGGEIQGRLLPGNGGVVFKGIPFAQPPEGELRWREPMPVKPWTGIRPTIEYGAPCAQSGNGNIAAISKEDCLYLNVWTAEWPPSKSPKPVMLWLYGGANTGGSAIGGRGLEPEFDGANLAKHGVVFVSINYRLGLLGFMGHPELTAEAPAHAAGAFGLLDQVAGLKWVRDNIAKFGGDPRNVTLFGQSAGAQNTTILLTSPMARGLIHRAIAESGTPMIGDKRLYTPAQMEKVGLTAAEALNAPAKGAVAYLRTLPAADILKAMNSLRPAGLALDVGMDGFVLPSFPPEVYRSGKALAIPMMVGNNGREMGFGGMGGGQRGAAQQPPDPDALRTAVENFYKDYPDLVPRALEAYGLGGRGEASKYPPYGDAGAQFRTDTGFRCEAATLALWQSKIAPVYEFEFTGGTAPYPPSHSAELKYVFGLLGDQGDVASARNLSENMMRYWTNFARTGNPNGPGLPEWPRYDAQKRGYMELSMEGPVAKSALRNAACGAYIEKLTRDLDKIKQMSAK
jgi:para-nitrobenzyl esterase